MRKKTGGQRSGGDLEDYTLNVRHHYYIHHEKNINSIKNILHIKSMSLNFRRHHQR